MNLRKLETSDATKVLVWMYDDTVTHDLYTNFSSKTLQDAEDYIRASWSDKENINLTIASDQNEYVGTQSLQSL